MKDVLLAITGVKGKAEQLQKMIPPKSAAAGVAQEIIKIAREASTLVEAMKAVAPPTPQPSVDAVPTAKQKRTKRKNRRKDYRAMTKIALELQGGRTDLAQGYFGRKLSVAKFSAHHEILTALKAGDLGPALDYCAKKATMIENALKDGSSNIGTSVTAEQLWTQELQRHEQFIVKHEAALRALEAGDPMPVKNYILSKIEQARFQVRAWSQKLKAFQSVTDGKEQS